MYFNSCLNIISVFFSVILDPQYIALQSQNDLFEKVNNLKRSLEKNFVTISKKSMSGSSLIKSQVKRQ